MIFVGCVLSVDVGIFRAAKDIVDAHIVKVGKDHKGLGGGMRSPRSIFESSACIDMILHHKNVTEAAMDAGFADLSYFTKLFKRTKGITPGNT